MRKILLIAVPVMVLLASCGGGTPVEKIPTEVSFATGPMADQLAKANEGGKLLFVEFYASWCGTCQGMFKNVFGDAEVGKYINENYVSLKVDLEKGEGPELKEKYNVEAFPTSIIFDGEGNIVKRHTGKLSKEELLEFAKI